MVDEEKETDEEELKAGQKAAKPEKAGKAGKSAKAGKPEKAAKPKAKQSFESRAAEFLDKHKVLAAGILGIAIIAIAFSYALAPEEADVEDFWEDTVIEQSTVKMIVVTSNRCPGCEENSSLEVLFQLNGIDYAINTFEESTADGQGLIEDIGIKKLPAFIIEEASISDNMIVKTKSGFASLGEVLHSYANSGRGTFEQGIFTFPEMDLEGTVDLMRPKLLLEEPCGDKTNFLIQLFADPYDPRTIERSRDFESLRTLLEAEQDINVEFGYVYLPTYSRFLEEFYLDNWGGNPQFVRENIEGAAKYLVCVNDEFGTKKFNRLQQQIYATYCGIDQNSLNSGNIQPLFECENSDHYDFFVTGEELKEAVKKAMIYEEVQLAECLYTVESRLAVMETFAEKAGIYTTPTVLVNCQYEVPLDKVLAAVCQINSEFSLC